MNEVRRVYGWLDTRVYITSSEREFMITHLAMSDHKYLGQLDPTCDAKRARLADLVHDRLSAAYCAENREIALQVWMNVLGAAVVKLAETEECPSLHVPGAQWNRGHLELYLCTGTSGERILLDDPYPYLCFPDDWVGRDLRLAFKQLFGPRVILRNKPSISGYPEDGMMYVVLDVPGAAMIHCPCGSEDYRKTYFECHGRNL